MTRLATGHREFNFKLTVIPCYPAFTFLESAKQAAGTERHQCPYPSLYPAYCNTDLPGKVCPCYVQTLSVWSGNVYSVTVCL